MGEAIGWFLAQPLLTQVALLVGLLTPLLVLYSYLNPPRPTPSPPPPKKFSVQGDVRVQEKK